MNDETEAAEVVRLFPDRDLTDDDAPIHRDAKDGCAHQLIRLDPDAHKVFCRGCDAEVDAFDYLMQLAGEWQFWVTHRKEAERRGREAQARLEETLRLERNARGRVKRHAPSAKLPTIPWGEANPSW